MPPKLIETLIKGLQGTPLIITNQGAANVVVTEGIPYDADSTSVISEGGQLRLISNTGFTPLGCTSVSVINVGTDNGNMTGGFSGIIKPGEEQSWEAPLGKYLPQIDFDATTAGCELVITFVKP